MNPPQEFSLSFLPFTHGDTGKLHAIGYTTQVSSSELPSAGMRSNKTQSEENALAWGVSNESFISRKVS